ncbi:MAG: hypothetical protein KGI25_08360 [Thaumarchaeota archaeon]|nr:hypothetical protein [Nitrososphaerota archaeon]
MHTERRKETSQRAIRKLPMWAGVAIILSAVLIGMFIITSGWGTDQATQKPVKVAGEYFRAVQWSGHLSPLSQYVSTAVILTGLSTGIFGSCWKSST